MDRREIKQILVSLELTAAATARSAGISRNTLYRYMGGKLRRKETRARIQAVLDERGKALSRRGKANGIHVPRLWDAEAPQTQEVGR